MATFDFRILLETVEGKKFSYYSSSFVDTSTDLVLSASQVYNRITGSVSASYQNTTLFTGSNVNTSYVFKDNSYLSTSLDGDKNTGTIIFTTLDKEYDRLLRYKFMGSQKVCNVLGLPSEQWVYVDQFRLPVDDESNYFEGNLKATNIHVDDTITFANTSTLNSDLPILIDTGSDRYIKFVDTRGVPTNALIMGYDVDTDKYEISASVNKTFHISNVDRIDSTLIDSTTISSSTIVLDTRIRMMGTNARLEDTDGDTAIKFNDPIANLSGIGNNNFGDDGIGFYSNDSTFPKMVLSPNALSINTSNIPMDFRVDGDTNDNLFLVSGSVEKIGILTDNPQYTLDVNGDIRVTGTGSFGRLETTVVSSSVIYSSGSNIFGDAISDTHLFNGHITASGDISASGEVRSTDVSANFGMFGTGGSAGNPPARNGDFGLQVTKYGGNAQVLVERVGGAELLINTTHASVDIGSRNDYPLHILHNNTDRVKIDTGGIDVVGHITASGNISSSGAIKGGSLDINGNADFNDGVITNVSNIELDAILDDATGGDTRLTLGETSMVAKVEDTEVVSLVAGKATFTGDISASGVISSSRLYVNVDGSSGYQDYILQVQEDRANKFTVDGGGNISPAGTLYIPQYITHTGDTDTGLEFTTNQIYFKARNSGFYLNNGHITASGNISASGDIYGEEGHFSKDTFIGGDQLFMRGTIETLFHASHTLHINRNAGAGTVTIGGNISGSATSTGSFGAGYIDNKLGIGTTSPEANLHIYQDSPSANQVLFKIGTSDDSSRVTIDEDGDITTDGNLIVHGTSGVYANKFKSWSDATTTQFGGGGPIKFTTGNTTQWNMGLDGSLTGSAGNHISASATSTGSFGHIMKGGINWDTAVSSSAASAGFGSGGGGGGSGTVTSIVAGDGLNGGTITSTGTISVDSASMGGFYSASMNDFTTTGFIKGNHITASGNISASDGLFDSVKLNNGDSSNMALDFQGSNPTGLFYDGTNFQWKREGSTALSFAVGNLTFGGGGNSKISAVTNTSVTVRGGTTNTVFNTTGITTEGSISASGAINTLSHITASGNISASGTSHTLGGKLVLGGSNYDGIHISSSARVSSIKIGDDGDLRFNPDQSLKLRLYRSSGNLETYAQKVYPHTNNYTDLGSTTAMFKDLKLAGDITASGNISSSGTITGNSIVGTLTGTATGLAGTPDIIVGSLTATSITSSIVTSSIIYTEGSNIFGDADDDTHQFTGSLETTGSTVQFNTPNAIINANSYTDAGLLINDDIYDYRFGTNPPTRRSNYIHIGRSSSHTVFNNSAGSFKFRVGGADKVVFDSSGNITTVNDITATGNISGSSTSTGSFGVVSAGSYGTATQPAISFKTAGGNTGIHSTNGTDRMDFVIGGTSEAVLSSGGFRFGQSSYAPFIGLESSTTVPKYTFDTDTNTGMGRTAEDKLGLYTGGVVALELTASNGNPVISGSVTSTGSFGSVTSIGSVTTPIVRRTIDNSYLELNGGSGGDNNDSWIKLYGQSSGYGQVLFNYGYNGASTNLIFSTAGTEQIRFTGTGGIHATDDLYIDGGHITASGNISSSGDITADNLESTTLRSTTTSFNIYPNSGNDNGRIQAGQSDTIFYQTIRPSADNSKKLGSPSYKWSELNVNQITASGNISSSGNIISNQITSSGFNLIGTGTAELEVAGHITASGNISSSGIITGNAINVNGTDVLVAGGVDISSDTNLVGGTGITLTGDTLSTTDGEIVHDSLSGFVPNEHIDHSGVTMTAGAGLSGGGTIAATRTFSVDSASMGGFYSASMNDFTTTGFIKGNHITASGNISSSGTITAERHDVGGITTGGGLVNESGKLTLGNTNNLTTQIGKNTSTPLSIKGNITASGNISASGFVSASGFHFTYGTRALKTNGNDIVIQRVDGTGDWAHEYGFLTNNGTNGGGFGAFGSNTAISRFYIGTSYSSNYLTIGGSSNTGNVGIGTNTPPTDKLRVVGNISSSGAINTLSHITASGEISSSDKITGKELTLSGLSTQGSETTAVMINGSNVVGTRDLGSNAFTSTTIGTTTNALTVDNTTLQLNTGTTFNGSAARTISVKDGGIDSDALAADISVTSLTATNITASGNISSSGTLIGGGLNINGTTTFNDNSITNVNQIDLDGFRADSATGVQVSLSTSGIDVVMEDGDSFTINSGEVDADFTYFDSGEASLIHGDALLSRVGISDTSPVSKLDVGGDLNVQSHITASGNISSSGNLLGSNLLGSFVGINTDTAVQSSKLQIGSGHIGMSDAYDIFWGAARNTKIAGSQGGSYMKFTVAGTERLSLGTTNTFEGNISASGGFHVSSSGNVMINSDNTGSMATHLGAFSVNYGNHTQLTGSLAANGDGYGDIVKIGGTTTSKGQMYYLDTDSTWTLSNATDDSAGADKLLAIALGTKSDIDGMLLKGFTKLNAQGTTVVGAPIYMNTSNGNTTFAANTTSGNIMRILGYCLTGGEEMYFNPDSTFVEVA